MIDSIIVKGPLGTPQTHHLERLSEVRYTHLLRTKVSPTNTYVPSPITGAQITVKYTKEGLDGQAWLTLIIPLSTATTGQNSVHAGFEAVPDEVTCAGLLVRVCLVALGFADEVEHFMTNTQIQMVELTWHSETDSEQAKKNLQARTFAAFESLRTINHKHDIGVDRVVSHQENGVASLVVTLKTDDQLCQYDKFSQAKTRQQRARVRWAAKPPKEHLRMLSDAVVTHVRNEVRLYSWTLADYGIVHPITWRLETLGEAMQETWNQIGFETIKDGSPDDLTAGARKIFDDYKLGRPFASNVLQSTLSRYRKEIKEILGVDIAIPSQKRRFNTANLARQLSYANRWKPSQKLLQMALCDQKAKDVQLDLRRGLEFLRDGVHPEDMTSVEEEHWLVRWKSFAAACGAL